jgi:IS4 transposase
MPAEPQRAAAAPPDAAGAAPELSALELAVLAFESRWTGRLGAKEAAIRAEFDLSAARYYQVLDALIESPVALRRDPILVRRLQRLRDARARARAARTFRIEPNHQDTTE